ncbi:hypothetical protein ACFYUR_18850 [Micromonospora haikouensis]|uniref:hypothetical protein n=1 Tax=Micromonospora haikouensis TaxID=686309 RepID=UPI00369CCFA3
MAAIGTDRATQIINDAHAAGITDEQLATLARYPVADIQYMSGREASQLTMAIIERAHELKQREAALTELRRIAAIAGHNPDVIAAKVATKTTDEITKLIADTTAYLRGKGIDTRPEQPAHPATTRQINYIMDLLARRKRAGDGGGFITGPTTREGVAKMTAEDASLYITSLTENY